MVVVEVCPVADIRSRTITKTPESGDRIWLMYRANDVETWSQVQGGRDVTTEIVVKAGGTV